MHANLDAAIAPRAGAAPAPVRRVGSRPAAGYRTTCRASGRRSCGRTPDCGARHFRIGVPLTPDHRVNDWEFYRWKTPSVDWEYQSDAVFTAKEIRQISGAPRPKRSVTRGALLYFESFKSLPHRRSVMGLRPCRCSRIADNKLESIVGSRLISCQI